MNILPVSVSLAVACSLSLALAPSTVSAAKSTGFFEEKAAANAIAKITEKLKAPVRVLVIEIKPASLTLQVQNAATPSHIDEYRSTRRPGVLAWLGDTATSGPHPVQLSLINPRLEENLFTLTDVNFGAFPETSREALKRVKVEGGVVETITIRRQQLLNLSGPVEWAISIRSPRESAIAYADASGKIRRLDLTGTTRAETLDLTQGGEMLAEAIAAIWNEFGTGPIFKSFAISIKSLSFKMRDPKNPTDAVGYYWDINGIQKSHDVIPAEIRRSMGERMRDDQLFSIDDVSWIQLPVLCKNALDKASVPGGQISSIEVDRPRTEGEAKPVRWKFDVRAGFLGEGTVVEFDAKSGDFTRMNLPKSRQAVVDYVEPETARRAIAAITRELNRAVGFLEITLSKENASATGPLSDKPDAIRQFLYTENDGLTSFGQLDLENPFYQGFNKTWLFTAAELEPVLPNLADLQRKTLQRLRLSEGRVERVTFFRHSDFYPQNRKVLVEIRAANPKGEDGRVVYDLQGTVIDVVGGGPESKALSATEAEAPANLRPLGTTDATPQRVAKFDSHFASFLKLNQKFGQTRWYKLRDSAPDKLFSLPREEFRKFGKAQCDILECVDRVLKVFAERTPPSDAIASSKAAPHARTREFWETYRKVWQPCCQQFKVLDQNWADWTTIGNPPDTPNKKPWQQEVDRLQDEIVVAQKRIEEMSPPKE